MQRYRLMWEVVLMVAVMAWVGWGLPQALAQPARVPQTGQTQCWDANGNLILCDGTGQDGDIQAGVGAPAARFSDRRNGTVRDNLTGLIWLQDASCDTFGPNGDGTGTWQQALDAANTLASGRCGLSDGSRAGDWRVPNVKELQSLIDFGFSFPPLSNAAGTGQCTATDCAFSGVQSDNYWSSTTLLDVPGRAWIVDLGFGSTPLLGLKVIDTFFLVWPVRGGN